MWVKLVLCGLIIAFCVVLGYFAGEKYRLRKKIFSQLSLLNERYLSELSYSKKPLEAFLAETDFEGDFRKVLSAVKKHEPPEFSFPYLTKEEKTTCEEYFSMLGRGDSASQRGYFAAKAPYLAELKSKTEEEAKKRGELYLKLGLLAGLALVILII